MVGFFLTLVLIISFGYNVFFIEEYVFTFGGPDFEDSSKLMRDYLLNNEQFYSRNIFIFRNFAFDYYLKDRGPYSSITYLDFKDEFNDSVLKTIKDNKGIVAVIDFPNVNKDSVFWKFVDDCTNITFLNQIILKPDIF